MGLHPAPLSELLLLGLAVCALAPSTVRANGGTNRLNRQPAGPYAVSVFTSPSPLTVGVADVSFSVEWADTGDLEPDARIIISAQPVGHPGQPGVFEATHDQASDPNFYAANVRLESAGRWLMNVQVIGLRGEGTVAFEVDVGETISADRLVRGIAVVAAIWIVVGAWIIRRRRGSTGSPRAAGVYRAACLPSSPSCSRLRTAPSWPTSTGMPSR